MTQRHTKRTGTWILWTLAGLIVFAPVCLWTLAWLASRPYTIKQQREATRLVEEFHRGFNADDFDAICREAYKCNELPGLKDDWISVLEDTRNRGGAFLHIIHSDIRVSIEPPSVRAELISSFERGELREIFDMNNYGDGPLKIIRYQRVKKR